MARSASGPPEKAVAIARLSSKMGDGATRLTWAYRAAMRAKSVDSSVGAVAGSAAIWAYSHQEN